MSKKQMLLIALALLLIPFSPFHKAKAAETVEIPIIMYHKVTKDSAQWGKFAIAPWELEADFKFLKANGYQAILIQDLIDFVTQGVALPQKPILLTFDDGLFSDFHYVYPLALTEEIPVLLSIIGEETQRHSEDPQEGIILPHITWSQVIEMANCAYVDIQNHSYALHKTQQGAQGAKKRSGEGIEAYHSRLEEDLKALQDAIKQHTGKTPSTFTYPFGAKSEGSDNILQKIGFQASLMTENRLAEVTQGDPDSLFSLNRLIRPHGKSLEQILNAQLGS